MTVFLLVVMMLGYAGLVYGGASQIFIWLVGKGGYSASWIFTMTTVDGRRRHRHLLSQRMGRRPA